MGSRVAEEEVNVVLIVLATIAWSACGSASFVYWWSKDYDVTMGDLPITLLLGALGPLVFFMGWGVHGDHSKVIKRRRA